MLAKVEELSPTSNLSPLANNSWRQTGSSVLLPARKIQSNLLLTFATSTTSTSFYSRIGTTYKHTRLSSRSNCCTRESSDIDFVTY